ncbi:MAG: aminoacyl-histidine dipeptidase, partial [Lachnospiraceae bacterium]|nr:aminoacyl-histidine dipeptidase [Lachnospiraceae bacterium]
MIYCENMGESTEQVLKPRLQERVIFLLNTVPDGVQNMCVDEKQKGLVKTSLNFGIMRLKEEKFELEAALRSSVSSEKYALSDKLRYL